MPKRFLFLLAGIILILDLFVFDRISFQGIRPDGGIIILVFLSLSLQPIPSMIAGFLIGLAQVGTMTNAIASTPLAMTLVGYLIAKLGSSILHESLLVRMVVVAAGSILVDLINLVWLDPSSLIQNLVRYAIGSAVYSAAVSAAVTIALGFLLQSRRW